MIRLIWTRSDKIGSKIIRKVTGEDVSHFAYLLDEKLVFHSNFHGCHPEFLHTFLKSNTIVKSLKLDLLSLQQEEQIYLNLVNNYDTLKYDYLAMLYMGVHLILNRLKIYTPDSNLWASKRNKMCVELAKALESLNLNINNTEMMTPNQLYSYLRNNLKGVCIS